ncbi:MAG: pyrroline-5-carboxylate reductase [Clostridiales bacterium]|nr:pyrroline-5-carboxylate reductase [Clostridiales bacterium]
MKLGLIGIGNMGQAIVKGYIEADPGVEKDIYAYHPDGEKAELFAAYLGLAGAFSNLEELMAKCDMLLLAVKPGKFGEILPQMAPYMTSDKVLVSVAAGITMGYMESFFAETPAVIRVMPNTPCLVGAGMSALCRNEKVSDEAFGEAMKLFGSVGNAWAVEEKLMDAVVGVSGSGPAYVYMFIEAMADGAVAQGMPRDMAYEFAAQTVLGAAAMVLETGEHPGTLKDKVCSPGGTTIEAVCVLEAAGFRSTVMDAVQAAAEKSEKMRK